MRVELLMFAYEQDHNNQYIHEQKVHSFLVSKLYEPIDLMHITYKSPY